MPFLRLAWLNVLRRLSRSVLTLVAMGVAAAVMTSGMAMSRGMTKSAFYEHRCYLDGDIIMFSPGFLGASPTGASDGGIARRILFDSGFNPIVQFYPDFVEEGYLASNATKYSPFTPLDMQELREVPGIADVQGFYLMPATVQGSPVGIRTLPRGVGEFISEGMQPAPSGEIEVLLNRYGGPEARVGDTIEIRVPLFRIDSYGIPYVDYGGGEATYTARVVGLVSWPTRELAFPGPTGLWLTETGYVHSPEIYLTEDAWTTIWTNQAGGASYPFLSLRIRVQNMSDLNVVAHSVRGAFLQYAVVSVPELVEHGFRFGLLDRFYQAPRHMWTGAEMGEADLAKEDFSTITASLLFVVAGMLMASQMLASVAARRSEIGVLKALGARKHEVTALVLGEAVVLAVMGASVGFLLVRLAAIHQALTNNMPLLDALAQTLREMVYILGMTMCSALLFGALPAWTVSGLTVMQVFRGE